MDSKAQNRRDWVKNIAIIFLVILLLLTFFSRTIMNASLPEVSAQYAQYATLSSAVKASGTVKANESYNVIFEEDEKVEQTRKVQSVYVKAGDSVEKDAPILALSNDPSEQLKNAREELAAAKENYTKLLENGAVDDLTSDKTLTDAQKAIEKAEDELKELEAEYRAILAGEDPSTLIKSMNDQIKELENQKKQAGKDIDAQEKQSDKDYDAKIKAVNKSIDDLNDKIRDVEGKKGTAEALMETDILAQESVYQKLSAAQNELDGAQVAYENAQLVFNGKQEEVDRWKEMVDAINASIGDVNKANELTNQIKTLQDTLDGLYLELDRYEEDYRTQLYELERTRDKAIEEAWQARENRKDAAEIERTYQEAVDAAASAYDSAFYTLDTSYRRSREDTLYQLNQLREQQNAGEGGEGLDEQIYSLELQLSRAEEDYNHSVSELRETNYRAVREAEDARAAAYAQLGSDAAAADETYANAETAAWNTYNEAADTLQRTHDRYVEDQNTKISETEKQITDAQAKLYVIDMPEVDDVIHYEFGYDLGEAQANMEKAQTEADAAKEELTKAEAARDEAKTKVDNLTKQTQAEGVAAGYRAELNGLKAQLEAEEAALERYNDAKADAKERFETARTVSDERYDDRIEAIREKISEKEKEFSTEFPDGLDTEKVEKRIKEQKDAIDDLKRQYEITENTEGNTAAERERELEKAKQKIAELEESVKTYENAGEVRPVTAPIAGRIVSVNYVPGDTVTSGATVASIEIADKGYVVEITMSAEEARKIQVGAPVSVTNSWWYSNITASIAQVKSDPQSQGKNRIIVMDVSGDISEGQTLNFSIGDRSQSYDSVLPNSAIREDTDGKFVLTVEAKKTPLGTRYTARRTTVEIIASDDTQSAVNGLYGSEFVITSSTTPISDGQQVRLAGD